jgi:hypothetical protein
LSEKKKLLSREEVWNVLQFADALYNDKSFLYGGGVYTPDILNSNLQNLNNDIQIPTWEKVVKALSNAVDNEDTLRSFSQYMEYFDTIYEKVANYKANMLSFDLNPVCTNAYNGSDFTSSEYKEDKKRVNKFLFNFDYQHIFRDIVKNVLRSGVYYCWYRETPKKRGVQKYGMQMLPQKYCKITGYWENGILYDIDLSFLLSATVDLGLYAPIFGKYYDELFNVNSSENYKPSNQFRNRTGSWAYWVQTSPDDGAWCFKADTSTFATVPPLANLMRNTVMDGEVQKLQYDKDFASAYGILVGQMMMKKDSKEPNDFSIEPTLLGKLLSLVQAGLSRNIKVGAMPTENNHFYQFEDKNEQMYTNHNLNTAALGASATRVIYTTDKCSEAELIAQITTDAGEVKKLYYQFANFLDFFVNQKTKKYKFHFDFTGLEYWFDKEERREKMLELADRGIILGEGAWAQAFGIPPHVFEQSLNEGHYGALSDKLGTLISIHTASNTTNDQGGRPKKKRVRTDSRDYDKKRTGKRT